MCDYKGEAFTQESGIILSSKIVSFLFASLSFTPEEGAVQKCCYFFFSVDFHLVSMPIGYRYPADLPVKAQI